MIWGGADLKTLFIMAAGNVYKMRTEVAGLAPLYAKAPAK